jgi:hypothetical protein
MLLPRPSRRRVSGLNGWSREDAELYQEAAFETWAARSRHRWSLDISVLRTRYGLAEVEG